jgi:CheY-like chemotaxis protein
VEDTASNVMLMTQILKRLGHTCDVAPTATEGVVKAINNRYDVILMDLHMTAGSDDGFTATERIRKHEEEVAMLLSPAERMVSRRHVPIMAVTSSQEPHEKEAAFKAGMDAFMTKPVNAKVLRDQLLVLVPN